MRKKLTFQRLSQDLEIIMGPELYALKGGFTGGYSDSEGGPPWTISRDPNKSMYSDYNNGSEYNNGSGGMIDLELHIVKFSDGSTVHAYKAPAGTSSDGNSNCLGYAILGDYFLLDVNASTLAKFGYETCTQAEASMIVLYNGSTISHAGKYDRFTDTYSATGGSQSHYTQTGMSLTEFYNPYGSDTDPNNDVNYAQGVTPVYYKLKNPTGYGIGY